MGVFVRSILCSFALCVSQAAHADPLVHFLGDQAITSSALSAVVSNEGNFSASEVVLEQPDQLLIMLSDISDYPLPIRITNQNVGAEANAQASVAITVNSLIGYSQTSLR